MSELVDQFNCLADGATRLAASSSTSREANHWWAESERFEALALLAETDPAAARRRYITGGIRKEGL